MSGDSKNALQNHAVLGENIRQKRQEKHISQEYLAEMLDISRQSISKWENGLSEPTRKNLVQLADIFECELSELLCQEDAGETKNQAVVIGVAAEQADMGRLKEFFREMPADVYDCYHASLLIAWDGMPEEMERLAVQIEQYTGREVYIADSVSDEIAPDRIYLTDCKDGGFDDFFLQLASLYGQNAVGVLLSVNKGKLAGIERLRKEGGSAICCEPEENQNGAWNAALRGEFEYVIEPLAMGYWIAGYLRKRYLKSEEETSDILDEKYYRRIVRALKRKSELPIADFREAYVIMGLLECMKRRTSFPAADFYVDYLEESGEEQEYLFQSIMRYTKKNVPGLTDLFELKSIFPKAHLKGREIRIWVADCGNGLEVYAVAMMLADYLQNDIKYSTIKIFATDMEEGIITAAIKARYTEWELREIPEQWKTKYFQRDADGWLISQNIRNMVIFSVHDIVANPPFARLDMIVCRNAMNLFRIRSRRTMMKRFSYALNQGGYLMLGRGQEINETLRWFAPVEGCYTLYKKEKGVHYLKPAAVENVEKEHTATSRVVEEILAASIPSCIIADEAYEIIYVGQQAGEFLEFKTGEFSRNLFDNLDREIGIYVNMLVRKLKKEETPQNRESAVIKKSKGMLVLHVLRKFILESWYYLIWFEDGDDFENVKEKHSVEDHERAELERELRISQDSLIQALEEIENLKNKYEVSNEKLQSANEELVVINDELQVANAELTATNRKLARVNGELTTANRKLAEKNGEFQKKVNKILDLSDGGGWRKLRSLFGMEFLYLNRKFCIKRMTQGIPDMTRISEGDLNQDISDMEFMEGYEEWSADAAKAQKGERVCRELINGEKHLMVEILPCVFSAEIKGYVVLIQTIS